MNGIDFIADTNALLYLLSGNSCMKPYLSSYIGLSVISEMELLSFSGITAFEEERIRSLIQDCLVLFLTENVKNKTIALRRAYKIKLPDAIIVATAIENKLQLITADKRLKQVRELNLLLIEP
jgi:pilT protein domain protein